MSSTANEIMRDKFENIVYMLIYRLYNDKETKRIKSINLYFYKIEKKSYKKNEKQFYFNYNNNIFRYPYVTKSDLYISSFVISALL